MGLFFIVITFQANNKYKFKKTAGEMLEYAAAQQHFINPDELKEMMATPENIVLIDIRTPREYLGDHIENALNIPYERLLDEAHESLFRNGSLKILYGMNSIRANSAWMLLTQYGYENISVLNGGLYTWKDPSSAGESSGNQSILDEIPDYDYASIMENGEN
jgi:rhodanese-related sulfurtransferase